MKLALALIASLFSQAPEASAFEGAFTIPGMERAGPRSSAEYGYGTAANVQEHSFRARTTVGDAEKESIGLTLRTGVLRLSHDAKLKQNLWNPDAGVSYRRVLADRNSLGAQLNVGSPSDKPFNSLREMKATITAFYQLPAGGNDSWWFFLNYSTFRSFLPNVPLPGFAYLLTTDDKKLAALLGMPFFVFYSPVERVWLKAGLFMPPLFSAEAAAMPLPPLRIAAGFQWAYQDFLLADRTERQEQFFFDQKRSYLELRMPLARWLSATVTGGYAFDRRAFKARSYFRGKDIVDEPSGSGYFATSVTARF